MNTLVAFGLGWPELVIISLVALLIFGKRLPEVARSVGRGIVEFKRGLKDVEAEIRETDGPQAAPPSRQLSNTPPESLAEPLGDAERVQGGSR